MNAKHTQQGDRHQVVIDCDTNDLITMLGMLGAAADCKPSKVLGPKATAQDYEIYVESATRVLRCMRTVIDNVDQQAAREDIRNRETA